MSGVLVCIQADGARIDIPYDTAVPSLRMLQHMVGGLVQVVPHGVKLEGETRQAYVDEEGRAKALPLNRAGTAMWLEQLGRGPFWYKPEVYGPLVIEVPAAAGRRS